MDEIRLYATETRMLRWMCRVPRMERVMTLLNKRKSVTDAGDREIERKIV